MAANARVPSTRAVQVLRQRGVEFRPHLYGYTGRGGTKASAAALGVDEHAVIKTLVFEDEAGQPLMVLMHGDRQVSTKQLARTIGAKRVAPCAPAVADRHSGYQVGGTSPFGTRRVMPVYLERTIGDLDRIYINGGSRGFLVEIDPADLIRVLEPIMIDCAIAE